MKNLFDQQIKRSFDENLGDIHASDELKSKLLARLNDEAVETPRRDVSLTAISPEFVLKSHQPKKSRMTALVAVLISAVMILASSSILNFYRKHQDKADVNIVETTSGVVFNGNTSEQIARETATEYNQKSEAVQINHKRLKEAGQQPPNNRHISYNSRARRI